MLRPRVDSFRNRPA